MELKKDEDEGFYHRRQLLLTHKDKSREIIQLQYTAWPDPGVPETPDEFDRFREVVRQAQRDQFDQKLVVHCSAGCGRTGAFCTIDSAIWLAQNGAGNKPNFSTI